MSQYTSEPLCNMHSSLAWGFAGCFSPRVFRLSRSLSMNATRLINIGADTEINGRNGRKPSPVPFSFEPELDIGWIGYGSQSALVSMLDYHCSSFQNLRERHSYLLAYRIRSTYSYANCTRSDNLHLSGITASLHNLRRGVRTPGGHIWTLSVRRVSNSFTVADVNGE